MFDIGRTALLALTGTAIVRAQCKSSPGSDSWPAPEEWAAFNQSVNGRLIGSANYGPVVPLSASCHDNPTGLGQYDAAQCAAVRANWTLTPQHLNHPTDIMSPIFSNNTCHWATNISTPCLIGNYPYMAVNVSSAEEIATTVKFAAEKNVRLNIKNTGHDFLGRSTGAGALSVWTYHLKSVEVFDSYSGGTAYNGSALKVGSGISSGELYAAAHRIDKMVVAGEQATVGYGGGYLASGGHSPLSSLHGLAVDSVLGFTIVLANGTIVDVDAKSSPDLYWAVRGGGPSTFGIVTTWTIKTFDTIPTTTIRLTFASNDSVAYTQALSKWIEIGPSLTDAGIYSYYFPTVRTTPIAPIFAPGMTIEEVDKLLEPFYSTLNVSTITTIRNATYWPSFYEAWQGHIEDDVPSFNYEPVGGESILMSRLVPRSVIENNLGGLVAQYQKFTNLTEGTGVGHVVAFHQAPTRKAGGDLSDNAANPAWRDAGIHFIVSWSQNPANTSMETIEQRRNYYVNEVFQSMRDLTPGSGAYANEASSLEPNWQHAFWGSNYPRLYSIKKAVDPEGVFYATETPGSEDWIVESDGALCKA